MIKVTELCPHCWEDSDYKVKSGVMITRCKKCGKYIVLCSMCPTDCYGCGICEYVQEAKKFNGEV